MAFKFKSQYNNCVPIVAQDLSNVYEQTYRELAPYERNEKGEFLNDSPYPKLVPADKVNIQEKIDSFFEDVDLYHILSRVALTGDLSPLDKKSGFYGDISNIPNNYNDINDYYKNLSKEFNSLDDNIKDLVNSGLSGDDLIKAINDLNKKDYVQENVHQENKESENLDNENK